MIKIFLTFLLLFIFTCKNKHVDYIHSISLIKRINIKEKEVKFFYNVSPLVYDDEILISKEYVVGNDNYFSPVLDESISIYHDIENQLVSVKCNYPFDKRIIIKLFSSRNNNVYSKIVLDFKEKFELIDCNLVLNSDENYFYLKPSLDISLGSIKIDQEIKYKSIEFNKDFVNEIKAKMTSASEKIIYKNTSSNDIVFDHTFSGFETGDAIELFSKSDKKVFSSLIDTVKYSYYDYENNITINEISSFNVYDLLINEFFYQNKNIFDISFSIDSKSFNMVFSL